MDPDSTRILQLTRPALRYGARLTMLVAATAIAAMSLAACAPTTSTTGVVQPLAGPSAPAGPLTTTVTVTAPATPTPAASPASLTGRSAASKRLAVPAPAAGELARTVANYANVTGQTKTLRQAATSGTRYQIVSACASSAKGAPASYTVTVRDARPVAGVDHEGAVLAAATLPCTGHDEVVGVGFLDVLASVEMQVPDLTGAHGYALLTPGH